jgi:hypothetical protein
MLGTTPEASTSGFQFNRYASKSAFINNVCPKWAYRGIAAVSVPANLKTISPDAWHPQQWLQVLRTNSNGVQLAVNQVQCICQSPLGHMPWLTFNGICGITSNVWKS